MRPGPPRASAIPVCQLYEIDEDGGGLFLTMELLEGEPLSERVAKGPLPAREAVQTALSVLSALAALHRKGIVHRDLKPSNIFLSTHGVKLLDFGLARPLLGSEAPSDERLTVPGMLLGTPSYMAPELIEGGSGDARSDLFTLGIVLCKMLAGKRPFRGDSVFEVARAIVHDEPPALGGSPGVVGIDRVVHRALRKPVLDRTQTADVFAEDLRSLVIETGDVSACGRCRASWCCRFGCSDWMRPSNSSPFSLPDAISSALSGLPSSSCVRRRCVAACRRGTTDLAALAGSLGRGCRPARTLLSGGDQVRSRRTTR